MRCRSTGSEPSRFSPQEGTRAAAMEESFVPADLARDRLEEVLEVQRAVSRERLAAEIGRERVAVVDAPAAADEPTLELLYEDPPAAAHLGRIESQADDVDGVTVLVGGNGLVPGSLVRVEIERAADFDLAGARPGSRAPGGRARRGRAIRGPSAGTGTPRSGARQRLGPVSRGPRHPSAASNWIRRARDVMPGGVSSPVRAFGAVGMEPLFAARGEGARIFDEAGRDYLDYVLSWGPLILGHAAPPVVEAVTRAAREGMSFGACQAREVELAERVAAWGARRGDGALRQQRHRGHDVRRAARPRRHGPRSDPEVRGLLPRPRGRLSRRGRIGRRHAVSSPTRRACRPRPPA